MANERREHEAAGAHCAQLCRFSNATLQSDHVVPVVLEFQQPPVAVYRKQNPTATPTEIDQYQAELVKVHREFLEKLSDLGVRVELGTSQVMVANPGGASTQQIPHDFTYVFNGLGVLMPGRVVARVAAMEGVRAITHNQERVYLHLDQSVPFSGAPALWERLDRNGHELKGDGVKVAVIDTGVDWTHPSFGGYSEMPNEKVIFAASYTGEPAIDNFGHGTHVAGIIAADASYGETPQGESLINGIAPKAKLMGYKVLTAAGSGSATNIILAMEDAVRRGADVMNLSLGAASGDPYAPECSAANNAMKAGVIVCVAAGNAGPSPSSVGAPGAAHDVITVGASTDDGVTAMLAELLQEEMEPRHVEMRLLEGSIALPDPATELGFVDCGMGTQPSDFPKGVEGKIALVQRGEVTFLEKAQGAANAGALACVIYNNREGNFFGTLGEEGQALAIPVVAVSQHDGEMLKAVQETGQLRLSPEQVAQPYHLAEFSSRGPNRDGWIKPELTAPGVDIYSATIPQAPTPGGGMPDSTGYTSTSGTSMATPHVAGAAALLRQAHPDWSTYQIKAALVNTARWMEGQGGIMQQGNGALDLVSAMDCRAILVAVDNPIRPTHSFGRVAHGGKVRTVSQPLTIQPLVDAHEAGALLLNVEIAGAPEGLTAELSAASIVCEEGCVPTFTLTLTADGAELADGAYYGFVTAEAEWGLVRLPFYFESVHTIREQPGQPDAQNTAELFQERIGKYLI